MSLKMHASEVRSLTLSISVKIRVFLVKNCVFLTQSYGTLTQKTLELLLFSLNWIYGGSCSKYIIHVRVYITYTLHEINRCIIKIYHQRNEMNLSQVFQVVNYIYVFILRIYKREENRPLFSHTIMLSNSGHEILSVFSARKILGIVKKHPHIWMLFQTTGFSLRQMQRSFWDRLLHVLYCANSQKQFEINF